MSRPILVTGAAGFIGMHVAARLLERGERVIGVDNFSDYYDVQLKIKRLSRLQLYSDFEFIESDVSNSEFMKSLVVGNDFKSIIHLAAQAGVRYSIDNPFLYERSNVAGHLSMLEAARHGKLDHFVYASSSSVYGERGDSDKGFQEHETLGRPTSLYAATKRCCETMSDSYAGLFGFPQSGLRFFTVYGPWGRPDMAYFLFTNRIARGEPIDVFGHGRLSRDFTYIDDIVDGILGILDSPPGRGSHEIYNIGDSRPISVNRMIDILEDALGAKAIRIMHPMQIGDVTSTYADISKINNRTGYLPAVEIEIGLSRFVEWWRSMR